MMSLTRHSQLIGGWCFRISQYRASTIYHHVYIVSYFPACKQACPFQQNSRTISLTSTIIWTYTNQLNPRPPSGYQQSRGMNGSKCQLELVCVQVFRIVMVKTAESISNLTSAREGEKELLSDMKWVWLMCWMYIMGRITLLVSLRFFSAKTIHVSNPDTKHTTSWVSTNLKNAHMFPEISGCLEGESWTLIIFASVPHACASSYSSVDSFVSQGCFPACLPLTEPYSRCHFPSHTLDGWVPNES